MSGKNDRFNWWQAICLLGLVLMMMGIFAFGGCKKGSDYDTQANFDNLGGIVIEAHGFDIETTIYDANGNALSTFFWDSGSRGPGSEEYWSHTIVRDCHPDEPNAGGQWAKKSDAENFYRDLSHLVSIEITQTSPGFDVELVDSDGTTTSYSFSHRYSFDDRTINIGAFPDDSE